ncbi:hypothetical protein [Clostridioides sp. ZZV14-6345]|uniref:hypothetical protein n=1 Tax=Clostridioides sp. ZZV14-6345 TaxID=2811496 RepID=UPI001D113A23|nr:hypothetical protein [Clostridioides sp. ZZV14-6345]
MTESLKINIKYYDKIIDRYIETCISKEEISKCGAFINNKKLYLSPADKNLDTIMYNDFELFNNLFNKYKTHQISLCELKNAIKNSLYSLLYYYNSRQDDISSIISNLKPMLGKIYTYDIFSEEVRETIDFYIGIFEWPEDTSDSILYELKNGFCTREIYNNQENLRISFIPKIIHHDFPSKSLIEITKVSLY